ncbi:MAG: hypothetical protein ACR2F6_04890 [Mycobacteriales bacterium]
MNGIPRAVDGDAAARSIIGAVDTTRPREGLPVGEQPSLPRDRITARRAILPLCAVLAVAVIPPVVMSGLTGSLGIAHNDDWSFIRSTMWMHKTGELRLIGWAQMSAVGLFWLGQPVLAMHASVTGLQVLTVVLTAVLVAAASSLGTRLRGRRTGVVAAAMTVSVPLIAPLTVTFMTDLPALALMMAALAVGLAGISVAAVRPALVAAGFALALAAVTIRETAAPGAVGLAAALLWRAYARRSRRDLAFAIGAGTAFGCAALAFVIWRHQLPGDIAYAATGGGALSSLAHAVVTLGVFTLPGCLLPVRVAAGVRARAGGGLAGALVSIAALGGGLNRALVGNYLEFPAPLGAELRGYRPQFLPGALWSVLAVIGAVGAVGLGVRLADLCSWARERLRADGARDGVLAWIALAATAAAAIALVLAASFSGKTYDRYLLPVAVPLSLSLLANARPWCGAGKRVHGWQSVAAASLALSLAFGWALTLTIDAYDGARWRAGNATVALGARPNDVDAGPEWVGYHQAGDAHPVSHDPGAVDPIWVRRLRAHPCWFVSLGPVAAPDTRAVGRMAWRDGLGRRRDFVIYRSVRPACR